MTQDHADSGPSDSFSLDSDPIVKGVYNRIAQLSFAWREFSTLYLHSEERSTLLRDSAPGFFGGLQRILVDSLLLQLSVLADPPSQGRFENLSLPKLLHTVKPRLLAVESEQKPWPMAESLVEEFCRAVESIQLHRNKRIAHADVATLAYKSVPLDAVTIADVRRAIDLAFQSFSAACSPLTQSGYALDKPIIQGDATAILGCLISAKRLRELELWLWSEPLLHDSRGIEVRDLILRRFIHSRGEGEQSS